MKNPYSDIRDRIDELPQWWDENGVPRYCDFTADETADIYVDECVLMLIRCQNCGQEFHVCLSNNKSYSQYEGNSNLGELIKRKEIHYGDPPNIGCCPSGPTMNSVPVKILEYWTRHQLQWLRNESFEIDVLPSWATENMDDSAL